MKKNDKRNILICDGMSNDGMIIATNAPDKYIKTWVNNKAMELLEGGILLNDFQEFKADGYEIELLYDSEIDNIELLKNIGYSKCYDLSFQS